MWRSPGDLTFMTDWGGNQSSCNTPTPAICAYVWIDFTGPDASPAGSTCFNAQTAPCWGLLPGGNADLSANPTLAAGSINSSAAVQPFTFTEIAVDLTAGGPRRGRRVPDVPQRVGPLPLVVLVLGRAEGLHLRRRGPGHCSSTTTLLQQRSAADSDPPTATNVGSAALELNVSPGSWVRDTATVTPSTATGNVNFRILQL